MAISKQTKDRLPAAAQRKITVLECRWDEVSAYMRESASTLTQIGRNINFLRNERAAIEAHRTSEQQTSEYALGGALLDSTLGRIDRKGVQQAQISSLDENLNDLTSRQSELNDRQQLNGAEATRLGQLLQSIDQWIQSIPAGTTIVAHSEKPSSGKEVTPDLIEKHRARISELLADIKRIDAAPYKASDAKRRAREQIEMLAERGRPDVYRLIETLGGIRWPEINITVTEKIPDSLALIAWLLRDEMISAIDKELGAAADDENALTNAQRIERLNAGLDNLLEAEREEEAIVERAGFRVLRRANADPRAVLGLSGVLLGPKRDIVHWRLISGG